MTNAELSQSRLAHICRLARIRTCTYALGDDCLTSDEPSRTHWALRNLCVKTELGQHRSAVTDEGGSLEVALDGFRVSAGRPSAYHPSVAVRPEASSCKQLTSMTEGGTNMI